jgi:hypothetical protein
MGVKAFMKKGTEVVLHYYEECIGGVVDYTNSKE